MGIDISQERIQKAEENLNRYAQARLLPEISIPFRHEDSMPRNLKKKTRLCYQTLEQFDVITWIHPATLRRTAGLSQQNRQCEILWSDFSAVWCSLVLTFLQLGA